ncbi:MAG: tetratricopeptide repeat protein [Methylococcaceae bacterium]|nr:tetratricopeptide repeat protein [Methylococcaceae bacterium]
MADPHPPKALREELDEAERLFNAGKRAQALATLDRLAQECPGWWAVHYNRGNVLKEMERWQEALESLDRALELATTSPWMEILPQVIISWIHNNRGAALAGWFRFDLARQAFEAALAADPANENARGNLDVLKEIDKIFLEQWSGPNEGEDRVH